MSSLLDRLPLSEPATRVGDTDEWIARVIDPIGGHVEMVYHCEGSTHVLTRGEYFEVRFWQCNDGSFATSRKLLPWSTSPDKSPDAAAAKFVALSNMAWRVEDQVKKALKHESSEDLTSSDSSDS